MKLIFFIVAGMEFYFRFALEIMWVTQGCFSYCWAGLAQSQGLFHFSNHKPVSQLGLHKKLGGGTAGAADFN